MSSCKVSTIMFKFHFADLLKDWCWIKLGCTISRSNIIEVIKLNLSRCTNVCYCILTLKFIKTTNMFFCDAYLPYAMHLLLCMYYSLTVQLGNIPLIMVWRWLKSARFKTEKETFEKLSNSLLHLLLCNIIIWQVFPTSIYLNNKRSTKLAKVDK